MGRSSGPRAGNRPTRYDAGTLSGFLGEGEVAARLPAAGNFTSDRLRPAHLEA